MSGCESFTGQPKNVKLSMKAMIKDGIFLIEHATGELNTPIS